MLKLSVRNITVIGSGFGFAATVTSLQYTFGEKNLRVNNNDLDHIMPLYFIFWAIYSSASSSLRCEEELANTFTSQVVASEMFL